MQNIISRTGMNKCLKPEDAVMFVLMTSYIFFLVFAKWQNMRSLFLKLLSHLFLGFKSWRVKNLCFSISR